MRQAGPASRRSLRRLKSMGRYAWGRMAGSFFVVDQMTALRLASIFLLSAIALPPFSARADDARAVDYVQEVKPIFAKHCTACHGAEKQKAGLRGAVAGLPRRGRDRRP